MSGHNIQRASLRSVGALLLVIAFLLAGGLAAVPASSAAEAAEESTTPLNDAYAAAAERYDVPRDLLVAIGWSETRLNGHDGAPSQMNGYGVMHLTSNPDHDTLALAAELTGIAEAELRGDDSDNIAGAAAVLADLAADEGIGAAERDDVATWVPLLDDFGGAEADTARLYAEAVVDVLDAGLDVSVDGEEVVVAGGQIDAEAALEPFAAPRAQAAVDHPGALWVAADSSNYVAGRSGAIDSVIIHVTQGSYAGSISWYQNPDADVSAHYTIRSSDGEVTQSVRESDTAWHAGSVNSHSVGIEHEGWVDDPAWFTESMYRSSAEVVRGIAERHGVPLDRDHILGHVEVPGTHTDPGPHWDWDHYMALLGGDPGDPGDPGEPTDPLTFTSYPDQQEGSAGPRVSAIQTLLGDHGFDAGAVDGQFGPATATAVRSFQTSVALDADGVVGAATWTALLSAGTTPALAEGASGDDVRRVQRSLTAALGESVAVDGSFGPATVASVRAYQESRGLVVDGSVGPQTWEALQTGR